MYTLFFKLKIEYVCIYIYFLVNSTEIVSHYQSSSDRFLFPQVGFFFTSDNLILFYSRHNYAYFSTFFDSNTKISLVMKYFTLILQINVLIKTLKIQMASVTIGQMVRDTESIISNNIEFNYSKHIINRWRRCDRMRLIHWLYYGCIYLVQFNCSITLRNSDNHDFDFSAAFFDNFRIV